MELDRNEIIISLKEHARHMRILALQMAYECGNYTHLGGGLSLIDALAVLYGAVLNDNNLPYDRKDKFILSKGHGVLGLYAALAEFGIIEEALLDTFFLDGSDLMAHPVMNPQIGIEASSGSLGQGISMAVGLALSAKKKGYSYHTYVICGNGEANEGSVWEAFMSAVNFKLDNLTVFLDNNFMQSDGMSSDVMNISDKYSGALTSLGFQVVEIDGNNVKQVYDAFMMSHQKDSPKIIVGNTIKGKGVSFMENNNDWHHNRLTKEQLEFALKELEAAR